MVNFSSATDEPWELMLTVSTRCERGAVLRQLSYMREIFFSGRVEQVNASTQRLGTLHSFDTRAFRGQPESVLLLKQPNWVRNSADFPHRGHPSWWPRPDCLKRVPQWPLLYPLRSVTLRTLNPFWSHCVATLTGFMSLRFVRNFSLLFQKIVGSFIALASVDRLANYSSVP